MSNWSSEFTLDYDMPAEIVALVSAGQLTDVSWHNDVCPSFTFAGSDESARLFVDHPDPEQRETSGSRFVVCLYDEEEEFLGTSIETDSLPEILVYLKDHWDIPHNR